MQSTQRMISADSVKDVPAAHRVRSLAGKLLRQAAQDPSARARAAAALAAAASFQGRALPAHDLAGLRMRLVDEWVALQGGSPGSRPIDPLLAELRDRLATMTSSDAALFASAVRVLSAAAAAKVVVYELVSSPNDMRAWARPLAGGQRQVIGLHGVRAARRGSLVVGRLVPATAWASVSMPTPAYPAFIGASMAFAAKDRDALCDVLAQHGAAPGDVGAAHCAVFGLLVALNLEQDAAERVEEEIDFGPGGINHDFHAVKGLYRCDDLPGFAERVMESGCVESFDDAGFFLYFGGDDDGAQRRQDDGDAGGEDGRSEHGDAGLSAGLSDAVPAGTMAEIFLDEGGFWLCAADDDDFAAVLPALRRAMASSPGGPSFEAVALAPIDDLGRPVSVN